MKRDQTTGTLGNLDDMIADMATRAQRPRVVPREALGQLMQNAFGGLGAGVAVTALMFYVGAPYAIETGVVVMAVAFGAVMFVRSIADEALDLRKLRAIQTAAKRVAEDSRKRLAIACTELDTMELDRDQWRRVAEQTQHDLDNERVLRGQLQQRLNEVPRANRTNYTTAKAEPEPQDVRDGRELLRSWYVDGVYISRPKANTIGWPDDRHAAAFDLLRKAGIAYTNGKQAKFTPPTHDEATRLLTRYLVNVKAQVEPLDNSKDDHYVDE